MFEKGRKSMLKQYDKIIIGAGLYGLYSALSCGRAGQSVLVIEREPYAFKRATYINQARVHMGYHYPRSLSTAIKSAGYFERFVQDYPFCINGEFDKIYATSAALSWSSGEQFEKFCGASHIPCEKLIPERFFREGMCDGAFLTKEYTYDAIILRDYLLQEIQQFPHIEIRYNSQIDTILSEHELYVITLHDQTKAAAPFLLNATYASTNQILEKLGFEKYGIKYELCEIILCEVNEKLHDVGITVMDGPFFSIMPFGKTGLHSLTSVTFTPHATSVQALPTFECQAKSEGGCSPLQLGNCNECKAKPNTAWDYMSNLARKYLKEEYGFTYHSSLYSMKPILKSSEIDDSRPTVIKKNTERPTFVSVLSGKINTVYDLDEVLHNE